MFARAHLRSPECEIEMYLEVDGDSSRPQYESKEKLIQSSTVDYQSQLLRLRQRKTSTRRRKLHIINIEMFHNILLARESIAIDRMSQFYSVCVVVFLSLPSWISFWRVVSSPFSLFLSVTSVVPAAVSTSFWILLSLARKQNNCRKNSFIIYLIYLLSCARFKNLNKNF